MNGFFEYPRAAAFGRTLPKSKIYGHARASARLKQQFVDQVDQIVWQYKLAPETINLSATPAVTEIQVFSIRLRVAEVDMDVVHAIDKAVAFPIIFELAHGERLRVIGAYKRPSEADSAKWVVSDYFGTGWEPAGIARKPLPTALDLSVLYEKLLSALLPQEAGTAGAVSARVARLEDIRAKQREAERIKGRLDREKQFNKRVEINAELRNVTDELRGLGVAMTTSEQEG